MAYEAVKGGSEAIKQAEKMLEYYRCNHDTVPLDVKQIEEQMRFAVDRLMGEGGVYSREIAALALKQAQGDMFEASFILRAFPSTLPREHYSLPLDTTNMKIIRRISATYKDVPGGQYLGPTMDYVKRLFRFELMGESEDMKQKVVQEMEKDINDSLVEETPTFSKVMELARQDGLLEKVEEPNDSVDDITRGALKFPISRSAKLQALARGEAGAMMALAYANVRSYLQVHPYVGELRIGKVDVVIPHPIYEGEEITLGSIIVTEAEIISASINHGENGTYMSSGYGLVFGQNEVKAISMGILDSSLDLSEKESLAQDEEFVLYHIDGIEAAGFISHFKLPHYVDFKSDITRLRSIQNRKESQL